MRKNIKIALEIATIVISAVVLLYFHGEHKPNERFIKIGIAVYNLDDSFIKKMTDALVELLPAQLPQDAIVRYEIVDGGGSDARQQSQINYLLDQDCDVLLLNLVKPASAASVLNEAKSRDIPVILYNREPNQQDMKIDLMWYVGTDGYAAGVLQAEMLEKLWHTQTDACDWNQNGMVDYILVEGEPTHYDTIRRTNAFLKTATAALSMNQLADVSGGWMRQTAYDKIASLPDQTVTAAEAVVCNNDDMALGVYEYYQERGFRLPQIIGINKSDEMTRLIDQGILCGTVDINMEEQIKMIAHLTAQIIDGAAIREKTWYASPCIYDGNG